MLAMPCPRVRAIDDHKPWLVVVKVTSQTISLFGPKQSSTCTHQTLKKCAIYVFKPKTKCWSLVPTNWNHSKFTQNPNSTFEKQFQLWHYSPIATHKTSLHPNIVQLLEKNAWSHVHVKKAFASMQQRLEHANLSYRSNVKHLADINKAFMIDF